MRSLLVELSWLAVLTKLFSSVHVLPSTKPSCRLLQTDASPCVKVEWPSSTLHEFPTPRINITTRVGLVKRISHSQPAKGRSPHGSMPQPIYRELKYKRQSKCVALYENNRQLCMHLSDVLLSFSCNCFEFTRMSVLQ